MSKQLAISAAFSIFMMAAYVLFSADTVRQPLGVSRSASENSVEISAPSIFGTKALLPSLR